MHSQRATARCWENFMTLVNRGKTKIRSIHVYPVSQPIPYPSNYLFADILLSSFPPSQKTANSWLPPTSSVEGAPPSYGKCTLYCGLCGQIWRMSSKMRLSLLKGLLINTEWPRLKVCRLLSHHYSFWIWPCARRWRTTWPALQVASPVGKDHRIVPIKYYAKSSCG
jgi:hypothetical protein